MTPPQNPTLTNLLQIPLIFLEPKILNNLAIIKDLPIIGEGLHHQAIELMNLAMAFGYKPTGFLIINLEVFLRIFVFLAAGHDAIIIPAKKFHLTLEFTVRPPFANPYTRVPYRLIIFDICPTLVVPTGQACFLLRIEIFFIMKVEIFNAHNKTV